jgi:hypothetical protein
VRDAKDLDVFLHDGRARKGCEHGWLLRVSVELKRGSGETVYRRRSSFSPAAR